MNDTLFYLAALNLVVCGILGVQMLFGSRSIRNLSDIAPRMDQPLPSVSIVVAARNEERHIETALRSLLQLDYDDLQILVVDDRSTDRTGEILDGIAAEHSRLTCIHLRELPAGWLGKNYALHVGASQAQGELILFTDADAVMDPSVLRRAVAYIQDHQIDHLPMIFGVRMPNWLLESFVVTFSLYFFAYFRPWKAKDPHSKAHVGAGGFNMIRADVYRQLGGHEPIRMRPDDDVKLGKLVKQQGFRQEFLTAVDLMYVPWYGSLRELIHGLEKNAFAGVEYSIWLTVASSVTVLGFHVFPFVAVLITSGWTQCLYALTVLELLLLSADAAYHGRLRLSCCLGFPIGATLFAFIQWRTMIVNLASGGIRWRDTHYPLAELKANRV